MITVNAIGREAIAHSIFRWWWWMSNKSFVEAESTKTLGSLDDSSFPDLHDDQIGRVILENNASIFKHFLEEVEHDRCAKFNYDSYGLESFIMFWLKDEIGTIIKKSSQWGARIIKIKAANKHLKLVRRIQAL